MTTSPPIVLKGSQFTLTVLYLHNPNVAIIKTALKEKLRQAPKLLYQAPVILNISYLPNEVDWHGIKEVIVSCGLNIVGVSGCCNERQRESIVSSGLLMLNEGKGKVPSKINSKSSRTQIVLQPIRSGQQFYADDGDLVVMSAISAGAEVIAKGHLHLYGTVRGRVIAGAGGDTNSRIFCTNLQAELIAIAGQYRVCEQIPKEFWQQPVSISLQNDQLFIEKLH